LSSSDTVLAAVGALGVERLVGAAAAAALALAEAGAASTRPEGAAAVIEDSLPLWCR